MREYKFEQLSELKQGITPQQPASLFESEKMIDYELILGENLTASDILNMTGACNIASQFYDVNAAVIVKNSFPCGVALGQSIKEAYEKAFDCDPIGAQNGIVAFTKPLDLETAKILNFVNLVIAPNFDSDAIKFLEVKNEIKLVKLNTTLDKYKNYIS